MNPDGSYNIVNLDRLECTLNVPWSSPIYFQNILLFCLMIFVLLAISKFRSYVLDWCWPCGGEHEDDWRLAAGCTYPILSICVHWSELGKRWSSLAEFCLGFIAMNLTLVFGDFLEQLDGWCQHMGFGRKDQEPRVSR